MYIYIHAIIGPKAFSVSPRKRLTGSPKGMKKRKGRESEGGERESNEKGDEGETERERVSESAVDDV